MSEFIYGRKRSAIILARLNREALDVQNVSNLSGVVHSFSKALTELRAALTEQGECSSDAIAQHPVTVLYSDKIQSLLRKDFATAVREAEALDFIARGEGWLNKRD